MGWEYSDDASNAYPPDVWVCDWCGHRVEGATLGTPYRHKQQCDEKPTATSAADADW